VGVSVGVIQKQYRHDYDDILVLSPYLNVVDLSYHNHLLNLFDKYCWDDGVLVSETADMVLKVRELHECGIYPWTSKEKDSYLKALRLKRGDALLLCDPSSLEFGEVVVVDNPRTVLFPIGEETHQLYMSGHLMHQIEFQKATENVAFIVTLLNDIISLFTADVLSKDATYLRKITSQSVNTFTGSQLDQGKVLRTIGGSDNLLNVTEDDSKGVQFLIKSHLSKLSASTASQQPSMQESHSVSPSSRTNCLKPPKIKK
jgi:hypothetical protein